MATQQFGDSDDELPDLIEVQLSEDEGVQSSEDEDEDLLTLSINEPILCAVSNTPNLYSNNLTELTEIPRIPREIKYLRDPTKDTPNYKHSESTTEAEISSCVSTVFNKRQEYFNRDKRPIILYIKNSNFGLELYSILSKGYITKFTIIDMSKLTDEDLENIFSEKQPNLTHISIENCPLITSIPDNAYTGCPLLTYLEIKNCIRFEEISELVGLLTNLHTLIISGDIGTRVVLPDNLWHLNETLQYLEVPDNTHFQQILVNSLKKSLLPDKYKPDVVNARNTLIHRNYIEEKAKEQIFNRAQTQLTQIFYDNLRLHNIEINKELRRIQKIERRQRLHIFRIEQDRQRREFMLSVEYRAETIARLIAEEQQCFDDDAEIVE